MALPVVCRFVSPVEKVKKAKGSKTGKEYTGLGD
jgi:hypothetical protein